MKTVLVLRHAKSSWAFADLGDHERPLNERGRRDAPRMGRLLRREGIVPELILSSTAERALATAEAVALDSGYEAEIEVLRRLYHAGPETYLDILRNMGDSVGRVMMVGHNPGMEELVTSLTGTWVRMPTAALAQIELPVAHWRELTDSVTGTLVNLWRPKEVKDR
ncbi:MAG: histidine phosphatase family protein [Anaerolineae bacterium]